MKERKIKKGASNSMRGVQFNYTEHGRAKRDYINKVLKKGEETKEK